MKILHLIFIYTFFLTQTNCYSPEVITCMGQENTKNDIFIFYGTIGMNRLKNEDTKIIISGYKKGYYKYTISQENEFICVLFKLRTRSKEKIFFIQLQKDGYANNYSFDQFKKCEIMEKKELSQICKFQLGELESLDKNILTKYGNNIGILKGN